MRTRTCTYVFNTVYMCIMFDCLIINLQQYEMTIGSYFQPIKNHPVQIRSLYYSSNKRDKYINNMALIIPSNIWSNITCAILVTTVLCCFVMFSFLFVSFEVPTVD